MFRRLALATAAAVALVAPLAESGQVGAALITPNIVPTVTCVIRGTKANSYWFGYSSDGATGWSIPAGSGNALTASSGGTTNRGQTTQFLSGRHDGVFVVNGVVSGTTLTWAISAAATRTVTTNLSVPNCPTGTPTASATPQSVAGTSIGWNVSSTSNSSGTLLTTAWNFTPNGVMSACSTGGTPLAPSYIYGYSDAPFGGASPMAAGYAQNVNAVAAASIVGSVTDSSGRTFTRTTQTSRTVTNVQLAQTVAGTLTGTIINRGFGFSTVIIDAYARCQFGTSIVTSRDPIWVDGGSGMMFSSDTISTTGTTGTVGAIDAVQAPGTFARDGGSGGGGSYHR
jgi:hypothetical protein